MPSALHRDTWNSRPSVTLPSHILDWLTSQGSLTARLKAHTRQFHVVLLFQGQRKPFEDERRLLHLPPGRRAWIREVLLCDGSLPLVYAHSVLPLEAFRGAWNLFATLGTRPLGEVLFADPAVSRCPLRFRTLGSRHPLYQRLAPYAKVPRLPARRSLFYRNAQGLLVTEAFLDLGALK